MWLKQPDIPLADAQLLAQQLEHACGLVLRRGQFGVITTSEQLVQMKTSMGMAGSVKYAIGGLPVDADEEMVEEVLEAIRWKAAFTENPRAARSQMSVWFMRADQPPPKDAYTFVVGDLRITASIGLVGGHRPQLQEKVRVAPAKEATWSNALQPGVWQARLIINFAAPNHEHCDAQQMGSTTDRNEDEEITNNSDSDEETRLPAGDEQKTEKRPRFDPGISAEPSPHMSARPSSLKRRSGEVCKRGDPKPLFANSEGTIEHKNLPGPHSGNIFLGIPWAFLQIQASANNPPAYTYML